MQNTTANHNNRTVEIIKEHDTIKGLYLICDGGKMHYVKEETLIF